MQGNEMDQQHIKIELRLRRELAARSWHLPIPGIAACINCWLWPEPRWDRVKFAGANVAWLAELTWQEEMGRNRLLHLYVPSWLVGNQQMTGRVGILKKYSSVVVRREDHSDRRIHRLQAIPGLLVRAAHFHLSRHAPERGFIRQGSSY